jgi:excisionase family DNA binding protein
LKGNAIETDSNMAKMLTTKKVAHLLNVSEATVKRWTDEGLLEAEKTVGGHRRFRVEKILRFQKEQQLGKQAGDQMIARPMTERFSSGNETSDGKFDLLFQSLVDGNGAETSSLILNAYMNGATLPYIFDELISKAMRKVGDLWYKGELTIAQEHLAIRTALIGVNALSHVLVNRSKLPFSAICCCVEEDFHDFPLHLTQALLENAGWQVINLGANTPFFSLTEAVTRHKPSLVCVSSTVFYSIDRAEREYKEFHQTAMKNETLILLGGNGFKDEEIRSRFPADFYSFSFTQFAGFIKEAEDRLI